MPEDSMSPAVDVDLQDDIEVWGRADKMPELIAALAKAQAEFLPVVKTAENPAFKRGNKVSKYADLAGVIDATRPALTKYGLVITQLSGAAKDGVRVMTLLLHSSGAGLRCLTWVPTSKPDAHGIGMALTYARRFAYQGITCVAAEDDDGNAASGKSDSAEDDERAPRLRGIAADILAQGTDRNPEKQGMWYHMRDPITGTEIDVWAPDSVNGSGDLFSKIGHRAVIKAQPMNHDKDCTQFTLLGVVGVEAPEGDVSPKQPPSYQKPSEAPRTPPSVKKGRSMEPTKVSEVVIDQKMNAQLHAAKNKSGMPDSEYRRILGFHGYEHGPEIRVIDFPVILKEINDYKLGINESDMNLDADIPY